jgi:hypothetical protein
MTPRGLTREKAAEYCGCETVTAFDRWVRKGIVPGPIPGTRRWDRKAIDVALDKISGLTAKAEKSDAATAYDEWRASQKDEY